jgi:uncharacterized protein YjbI with pentapeptide repeats
MKKFGSHLKKSRSKLNFIPERFLEPSKMTIIRVKRLEAALLAEQKHIFEQTLVRESLYGIQYLADVATGRATPRETLMKEKVPHVPYSINAMFGVMGVASGSSTSVTVGAPIRGGDQGPQATLRHDKKCQQLCIGDITASLDLILLEILLKRMAQEASLRYEFLIARELSSDPKEGVIPLACVGAQHIVEFLDRYVEALKDSTQEGKIANLPLSEAFLLRGLIEGRSGKWMMDFTSQKLKGRDGKGQFRIENAFTQPAMREYPMFVSQAQFFTTWPIQTRKEALHTEMREERLRSYAKTSFRKGKEGFPKYLIYVPDDVIKEYDYKPILLSTDAQGHFNYYPHVRIVRKLDIELYQRHVDTETKAGKPCFSFFGFLQKDYPSPNETPISAIWVEDNLSHMTLIGGDYTGVDFCHTTLEGVTLVGVNLTRANCSGVNARGLTCKVDTKGRFVLLIQADFSGANLTQANLSCAKTEGIQLSKAILEESTGLVQISIQQSQEIAKLQQSFSLLQQAIEQQTWELRSFSVALKQKLQGVDPKYAQEIEVAIETCTDGRNQQVLRIKERVARLRILENKQAFLKETQAKIQEEIQRSKTLIEKIYLAIPDLSMIREGHDANADRSSEVTSDNIAVSPKPATLTEKNVTCFNQVMTFLRELQGGQLAIFSDKSYLTQSFDVSTNMRSFYLGGPDVLRNIRRELSIRLLHAFWNALEKNPSTSWKELSKVEKRNWKIQAMQQIQRLLGNPVFKEDLFRFKRLSLHEKLNWENTVVQGVLEEGYEGTKTMKNYQLSKGMRKARTQAFSQLTPRAREALLRSRVGFAAPVAKIDEKGIKRHSLPITADNKLIIMKNYIQYNQNRGKGCKLAFVAYLQQYHREDMTLFKDGLPDFSGIILEENMDLSNTDFSNIILTDSNFKGANLEGADFYQADLRNVKLSYCKNVTPFMLAKAKKIDNIMANDEDNQVIIRQANAIRKRNEAFFLSLRDITYKSDDKEIQTFLVQLSLTVFLEEEVPIPISPSNSM